jgi:hypothetical protein
VSLRLRMPAQLTDWLGELRVSDQPAADEVGAAVVALISAPELPGPPRVAPAGTDDSVPAGDLSASVDREYQHMLDDIGPVRRRALVTHDSELTTRSFRLASSVEAFRSAKEVAKARLAAATAVRGIETLLGESGTEAGDADDADRPVTEAAEKLHQLIASARELRRTIRAEVRADGLSPEPLPDNPDLLELRADPLGTDIRILFAIEPPGTATLLAALEGPEAITDHMDDAMILAGELIQAIRAEGWPLDAGEPDGGGQEFADASDFLAELFPARGDAIRAKAAALTAATMLADLRHRRAMTRAELAELTGIEEGRLGVLEAGDLRLATLHELTACLRTLGGSLEITVLADGDRTRLS